MIRKTLLALLILIPFCMKAQMASDNMKVYSVFSGGITKMIETPEKVYYLSAMNLYSFDKETEESYIYMVVNKLSDSDITNIYYNKRNKYLLITYNSGNIDLLYDDGTVVNLPDIKDAVLTTAKTINDVGFHGNRVYVTTSFGLVIFDDQKHEVVESGIYNLSLGAIDVVGDYIVLCYNYGLYISKVTERHNSFDKFIKIAGANASSITGLENGKVILRLNDGTKYMYRLYSVDFVNNKLSGFVDMQFNDGSLLADYADGLYTYNATQIGFVDAEGNITTTDIASSLQKMTMTFWDSYKNVWVGDANGIANYKVEDDGTLTVLRDKFIPETVTVKKVVFLNMGKDGKLYLCNSAGSVYMGWDSWQVSQVNTINNGEITNVGALEFEIKNKKSLSYMYSYLRTTLCDTYNLCEDPNDPDAYYIGSYWEGMYKVKDGVAIQKFDWTNSTITMDPAGVQCQIHVIAFDKHNNLWCIQRATKGNAVLHMLKAENCLKETTTISDWSGTTLGDYLGDKDNRMIICKHSNMIVMGHGGWNSPLVIYDTKGTYDDMSDDDYMVWEKFTDQDGKNLDPERITAIVEDHDGRVWVGTPSGVFEITRPANGTDPQMTINRIKVPRNDGTPYADYLLDGIMIYSLAVDNSNRKWIGTESNGVYLVSEDGDEILAHFTMDNSDLPSNKIFSVLCDPNNNKVYFGTDQGLVIYTSNSAPASEDYSDVYAYPNPVRPDYTGWITIRGLMDKSLVKIADAAGNVFFTTRSEGGMVTWDGCDASGERVKTGVYYVFASQNENGDASGVVTKIMVVN